MPKKPVPNPYPIRAWHIGEHGEIFAGRCGPVAMRNWFRKLIGDEVDANEQIEDCFEEIPQAALNAIHTWNDGMTGKRFHSSYRREAERCVELPMQIATTYN